MKWRVIAELFLSQHIMYGCTIQAESEEDAIDKAKVHIENKYPGSSPFIKTVERVDK